MYFTKNNLASTSADRRIAHGWQSLNGAFPPSGRAINKDPMFELFRRGEIIPDGRTNKENALIASSAPSTLNHQRSTSAKTPAE
jgi:hypothetical protein